MTTYLLVDGPHSGTIVTPDYEGSHIDVSTYTTTREWGDCHTSCRYDYTDERVLGLPVARFTTGGSDLGWFWRQHHPPLTLTAFDQALRAEYANAMRDLINHSNSLIYDLTGGNVPSARWIEPARRPGRIKRLWLAARERLTETWGVLRHGLPDYDGWDD